MIDVARGSSLGHYPCQGVDETTLSIIQLAGRYRKWLSKRSRFDTLETDQLILWDSVPPEFVIYCWPALVGFSFTAKAWGHVLVDGLSTIEFQDQAFDHLVLKQERKELIRAVVRHGTAVQAPDIISGKQGGKIFLLHGPPGVGKTLTAEAIADVLHRPLYYVTMGELGVTPGDLERRPSDVVELCAEWEASAVLDEADVFLETRGNSDLIRNAMVCVVLRILEYHPGMLFLTTNRIRTIDLAFESRIAVALRYEALDRDAWAQI
jgi:AAA+ superfamily predicted ATPase